MLERLAKRASEHGKKNLSFEYARRRPPIDVEVGCVGRFGAVFQDVHPPGIFAARRHVIRHDVEDQAHAALAQIFAKRVEIAFGAEFRIETRRIGDVIAVLLPRRAVRIGEA